LKSDQHGSCTPQASNELKEPLSRQVRPHGCLYAHNCCRDIIQLGELRPYAPPHKYTTALRLQIYDALLLCIQCSELACDCPPAEEATRSSLDIHHRQRYFSPRECLRHLAVIPLRNFRACSRLHSDHNGTGAPECRFQLLKPPTCKDTSDLGLGLHYASRDYLDAGEVCPPTPTDKYAAGNSLQTNRPGRHITRLLAGNGDNTSSKNTTEMCLQTRNVPFSQT
jgi:hypothetical protein